MSEDTTEDLRRELAELGATGVDPEDFGLAFRSADSFFDVVGADTTPESTVPPRRAVRRWLPPALVAAAVVVLVSAVLVPRLGGSDDPKQPGVISPPLVTVAQVLRQAADASASQPDTSNARYWYVEAVLKQGSLPEETQRVWWGHREPGLVIDSFGRSETPPASFSVEQHPLTWDELVDLPTQTSALRALLFRYAGTDLPDVGWRVVKAASFLLTESPAPPELRRALWQVIASVPGAVLQGAAADSLGRTGTRVVFTSSGRGRVELLIDTSAGRVLESVVTLARAGTDVLRTTFVEQAPADSIPD